MCLHYFRSTPNGCSDEVCSVTVNILKRLVGKEGEAEEK